jgi:hypothetical protein
MNDLEELIKEAKRGHREAQKALFELAEEHFTENEFEKAANLFKEVARSYRIAAFSNRTIAEENQAKSERAVSALGLYKQLYKQWFERYQDKFAPTFEVTGEIPSEYILKVVVEELLPDEAFAPYFRYIAEELTDRGYEFYSPGGTIQRRVMGLLDFLLNKKTENTPYRDLVKDIEIRVALEPLAEEVIKRYNEQNAPSTQPS